MRLVTRLALAAAAVAVAAAVVVTVSAQSRNAPEPEPRRESRFEVQITDEMLRHSRLREVLYFAGNAWSAGVLLLVLLSGASNRIRDASARITRRPFPMAMIYIAIFTLATSLLEFPLTYYSGYVVTHQFGLSDQTFASWMFDLMKGLGVSLALGSVIGALALLGIRKVRRWWLALWACSIPLILLMVVIQPLVLDPIFNRFEPLKDQALRQKLLDLASRAGIEGGRVYEVDKSKQTKTMNAYVNGIGPSARIVMWDTLLAKMDHDEVLAVMGHEMGHYVMKHMWKGLAFTVVVSFGVFFVMQQTHDRVLRTRGERLGLRERGDPATVPLLLLIGGIISFLLSPVVSAYSRTMEHDADVFALELTHLNEPAATAFVKMAEDSKRDPSPHPFIRFWRYTHPPIAERIPFALSYRPWEEGRENRLWKPRE